MSVPIRRSGQLSSSHEELQDDQRVPLVNGEAYVEILSDNASIIFEDKNGNRYAGSIPYHFERIVDEKAYMSICREYSPRDYRVLLFNYESIGQFTYKNAKEVNAAREIISAMRYPMIISSRPA